MKYKGWVYGVGSAICGVILIALLILTLIYEWRWLWLILTGVVVLVYYLIVTIVLLVRMWRSIKPRFQADVESTKQFISDTIKKDRDNPDNWKYVTHKIVKVGERGHRPTPVGVYYGYGFEKMDVIIAIINLENLEKDVTILRSKTIIRKEQIREAVIDLIGYSPTTEEITFNTVPDEFGIPRQQTTIKRPFQQKPTYPDLEKEKIIKEEEERQGA